MTDDVAPPTPTLTSVAIIGGGPAGLSAALQLARGHRSVHVLDSHRPRHSPTLSSHGFLTRDGIAPLELRRLGREDVERYPSATVSQAVVREVSAVVEADARAAGADDGIAFRVRAEGVRGSAPQDLLARRVLVASGLIEELPDLPSIRAFYGTALHSCIECDGFEKSRAPLALIGDTTDLFARALEVRRYSSDLMVFTGGGDAISADEEQQLASIGVSVERRRIADIVGDRDRMTGIRLEDGSVIARVGGFVRPRWHAQTDFLGAHVMDVDDWGLLHVSAEGETSIRGLYAAGDVVPPGPGQLIIAAGDGARVAAALGADLTRAAAHAGHADAWES